jgi:hypothetical protein
LFNAPAGLSGTSDIAKDDQASAARRLDRALCLLGSRIQPPSDNSYIGALRRQRDGCGRTNPFSAAGHQANLPS